MKQHAIKKHLKHLASNASTNLELRSVTARSNGHLSLQSEAPQDFPHSQTSGDGELDAHVSPTAYLATHSPTPPTLLALMTRPGSHFGLQSGTFGIAPPFKPLLAVVSFQPT